VSHADNFTPRFASLTTEVTPTTSRWRAKRRLKCILLRQNVASVAQGLLMAHEPQRLGAKDHDSSDTPLLLEKISGDRYWGKPL
jgi:hypothetical protein